MDRYLYVLVLYRKRSGKPLFFSAGVLPRNQPKPGGKLVPASEVVSIGDRCDACGRCYRTNSFNFCDSLTSGFCWNACLISVSIARMRWSGACNSS